MTGALEPPQPAREKERTPAITRARDTGTLRKDDLMRTKDTNVPRLLVTVRLGKTVQINGR